jgi:mannose-1-phosphate guanylyltransferase
MNTAFILGAGLGNRLRPLTDQLPKPLVPLFHRPLAAWAMDACRAADITRFAINTHHLPEAWTSPDGGLQLTDLKISQEITGNGVAPKSGLWHGLPVDLFHEPLLLETGGGLKNIAAYIGNHPLLIHNGDIFSTLPLDRLISAHAASGLPVTLAVRSEGQACHLALDLTGQRVTDIREMLHFAPGTHVFTGIYCISPEFLDLIPANEKISVIPAFLNLAAAGKLGAIILDEGLWMDLGDRASYLQAHRDLHLAPPIHPDAKVSPDATVERSTIGPGAIIERGAILRDSIIWPGAHVTSDAQLDGCIVFSKNRVTGQHRDADL